jgi:hypothetical protein
MRDVSGRSADASAAGVRSADLRTSAVRAEREPRPDYRLLEEEFVGLNEEGGDEREELAWEPDPYRPRRRHGRANAVSALLAGVAVFVALTVHALGPVGPAGGRAPRSRVVPRVSTAAPTSRVPPRTSRPNGGGGGRHEIGGSRRPRPRDASPARHAVAAPSVPTRHGATGPPEPPTSASARPLAAGEFGFER